MTAPLDPASALANQTTSLGFDAASQVSTTGYQYDARGRLIGGGGSTYTWDGASRLTGVGSTTLGYNGVGQVVTRTAGLSTTRYSYNQAIALAPPVAERDEGSGRVLRYYVWAPGGSLLYAIDVGAGNRPVFYHFDRTGSTLALSDATGTVTDADAYTPDGRLLGRTGSSPQPFTFVGRWGIRQEGTSGTLYQMRARYYDAVTGRFLSQEPIWPQLANPAELNPYQYALNRPVGVIDVTGTASLVDFPLALTAISMIAAFYSDPGIEVPQGPLPPSELPELVLMGIPRPSPLPSELPELVLMGIPRPYPPTPPLTFKGISGIGETARKFVPLNDERREREMMETMMIFAEFLSWWGGWSTGSASVSGSTAAWRMSEVATALSSIAMGAGGFAMRR